MLHAKEPEADVGVIVGRFQVPDLTPGHLELLDTVRSHHQRVVVFLGHRPGVLVTRSNPLDFRTRRLMLQEHYPDIDVLPLPDQPTDEGWSADLDHRIAELLGNETLSVLLYGSRDSFVPSYKGRHRVVELATSKHVSGTEVRALVSHTVRASSDFRRGVVYAAFNRHPVAYQTVDCAVVKHRFSALPSELLVARKKTDPEGLWRFPGGFVRPGDSDLAYAASRELHEEVSHLSVHSPSEYVGSAHVDDWRYRSEEDCIMTALFLFDHVSGEPSASDDVDEVRWFPLSTLSARAVARREVFVPAHRPLFDLLIAHLKGSESKS